MPFVYSIKCKIEPYKEYIGQTGCEDFQVRLNGRQRHLYNAVGTSFESKFFTVFSEKETGKSVWTNLKFRKLRSVGPLPRTDTITRRVGTRIRFFMRRPRLS